MIKQGIFNPRSLFISRLLSRIISPFFKLFSRRKHFLIDKLPPPKILITEYDCIGDVILVTPAIQAIKQKYPEAKIYLVVVPQIKKTIEATNLVDECISFIVPWHRKFNLKNWKNAFSLVKSLRKEKFDLGIDFNGDIRNLIFLWKVKSKISLGYDATGGNFLLTHSARFPFHKHQLERALILLKQINIDAKFTPPKIDIFRGDFSSLKTTLKEKFKNIEVVIHPGANHSARLWPEEYWFELIEKLININTNVSVVIPPGFEEFENNLREKDFDVEIFKDDIYNFALWLKGKTILIGPDSMAVHLAIALGIYAIALFGSQDPKLTKPYGDHGFFLKANAICKHKKKNWRLCEECMKDLKPQMVMEKVNSIIKLIKN